MLPHCSRPKGTLLGLREDVGRQRGRETDWFRSARRHAGPLVDALILVSGRAGFELVRKKPPQWRRSRLATRWAPTSLAVELANVSG